ncbi:hypothetical protein ACLMJK_002429 [Lecanora helva]
MSDKVGISLTKEKAGLDHFVPPPGRDFLIEATPVAGSIARRQVNSSSSGYLDATGQIQPLCQRGSVFRLVSGQLFSGSKQISISRNTPSARFGTSDSDEELDETFAVGPDEALFWKNDAFVGGSASFGADANGIVNAFFSEPVASNFVAVSLRVLGTSSESSSASSSLPVPAVVTNPPPITTNSSSAAPSTSAPSPSSTLPSTTQDQVQIARSVLSRETYTDWCSSLLGMTASDVTATIISDVTASITQSVLPTQDIATNIVTLTSYVTAEATVTDDLQMRELSYDTDVGDIVKGQDATLETPTVLQTFAPEVLSSACSDDVGPATAITMTTTLISTILQTHVDNAPYVTKDVTTNVLETISIEDIVSISSAAPTSSSNTNFSTTSALNLSSSSPTIFSNTTTSQSSTPVPTSTAQISNSTQLTTSTPASSSSASSTTSICPPTIVLASPTPIVGSLHGSQESVDDASYELDLPFQMQMFDYASSKVFVSTNGVSLSFHPFPATGNTLTHLPSSQILSLDNGTNAFQNVCPPSKGTRADHPAYAIPDYSAFPFFDDTYVYKFSPQGIYYEYGTFANGSTTPTAVSFEYYMSHYFNNTQYYHYTVFYDSASPGQFTYRYYQISDDGFSSTVGVQNNNASSPGAPTALTFFCSTCNDNPDTTKSGGPVEDRDSADPCPVGTVVPGLELYVTTFPNNTGFITQDRFDNCAQ